jgi:hypothetical protein
MAYYRGRNGLRLAIEELNARLAVEELNEYAQIFIRVYSFRDDEAREWEFEEKSWRRRWRRRRRNTVSITGERAGAGGNRLEQRGGTKLGGSMNMNGARISPVEAGQIGKGDRPYRPGRTHSYKD